MRRMSRRTLLFPLLSIIAIYPIVSASDTFGAWEKRNGRRYRTPEERAYRQGVFSQNMGIIAQHNAGGKGLAYSLRANSFSDLTRGEWAAQWVGGYVPGPEDWIRETSGPVRPGGGDSAIRDPLPAPDTPGFASSSPDPYMWPFGPPLLSVPATKARRLGVKDGQPAGMAAIPSPAAANPAPASLNTTGTAGPDDPPTDGHPLAWGWSNLWPWAPSATPTPTTIQAVVSASPTPFPVSPTRTAPTATQAPFDNGAAEPLTPLPPDLPPSVDWSKHALMQGAWPIRNQGTCGACYAFATIGSIEGALNIRDAADAAHPGTPPIPNPTVPRYVLSEQQVLDCSANTCAGGGIRVTWRYIREAGGLCTAASYPYNAVKGDCAATPPCGAPGLLGNISGYVNVERQDEIALLRALAVGPVTVAIQADQQPFMFYSSGVLDDEGCGTALNHAVVAVGYGVESTTGQAYFKLRNSWGPGWGENGYIRIARGGRYNPTGQCGVQMDPTYPILSPL